MCLFDPSVTNHNLHGQLETDKMASNVEIVALLAFLMAINSCFAAKVSIIPMFGRSHYMVLAKLAEELHIRGHEVFSICLETSRMIYSAVNTHLHKLWSLDISMCQLHVG